MGSLKKSFSFNMKQAKNDLSNIWFTYQPVYNPNTKTVDYSYKTEIQQFIKDIEDTTVTDSDAWTKWRDQMLTEEFKQKLREIKIGQNDFTLLHMAAKSCRRNFCQFLIQEVKIDRDVKSRERLTPLHVLVKSNLFFKQDEQNNENTSLNERLVAFKETYDGLIEKNADPNQQDELGCTCLHYAAGKNNYVGLKCLINTPGVNIHLEDKKFMTPLHMACKYGNEEVAELLVEKMNAERLFQLCIADHVISPLHLACRNKNEKYLIVRRILDKLRDACSSVSASVPTSTIAPLLSGTKWYVPNYIDLVLKKEDPNRQSLLSSAIENNHLLIVELLLGEYNFPRDQRDCKTGNLPIHIAAKNGSIEMFDLLRKHDCISFKTNNSQENSLHIAAVYNKHKFIREYVKYEQHLLDGEFSDDDEEGVTHGCSTHTDMPCMCRCELELRNFVKSEKQRDKNYYTPLMCAVAWGNHKCVYELINASTEAIELDTRDKDGNTIFHIAVDSDNVESLKYLLQLDAARCDLIYTKNNFDDTILHTCCRNGNLEILKLIVNNLFESNLPVEQLLYSKNRDGFTCFHLACMRGHFNLIEYFLKEKKLNAFLECFDNYSNTALHMATENGHSPIVDILLEHGVDLNAKNEENMTALDVSCRKGFFEISKTIINKYSSFNKNDRLNEFPLHTACYEGAYEVVKLLLQKGSKIDQLNNKNENCLDIAISRGHREVIRVLLEDKNWFKLIRLNNSITTVYEDEEVDDESDGMTDARLGTSRSDASSKQIILMGDGNEPGESSDKRRLKKKSKTFKMKFSSSSTVAGKGSTESEKKFVENPQLCAIYDNKMWDILKIILDKCVTENEIDFSIIDPPVKSMSRHPLMLIARSGQEGLLKHETTRTLLHLKWRLIPRFAFYFNLIFYMIFLVLFSVYSIELSKMGKKSSTFVSDDDAEADVVTLSSRVTTTTTTTTAAGMAATLDWTTIPDVELSYFDKRYFEFHLILVILLHFQLIKELTQILFIDGLTYFLSLQNLLELFTYTTALMSLFSNSYAVKSAYGSVAVLCAFIAFPLFTQKLKIFGLYVVAFRRTLANSAKFFPIFLIIFTGFIISFRIRSNFDVNYFNSTSYAVIRTLTMVVGELDTAKMGLYNNSLPNYFIYFMFIGLMCTILLNLFVGIAVGEIKTVLDEADIQQTSMRIMFVLKIQSALYLFRKTCLRNLFNMSFSKYSLRSDNNFQKLKKKVWNKLYSRENIIKLTDPQKRLEESFTEMSRGIREELKTIRFCFTNQIVDIESRLSNSQRRLQDSIIELSNRTIELIDEFKQESKSNTANLSDKLTLTESRLETLLGNYERKTDEEFKYTNNFLNNHLKDAEQHLVSLNDKIQNILIGLTKKQTFQYESIKENTITNAQLLRSIIVESLKSFEESFNDSQRNQSNLLDTVERSFGIKIESIMGQLVNVEDRMRSSFSSHMTDISGRLSTLADASLILNLARSIDELNSKIERLIKR